MVNTTLSCQHDPVKTGIISPIVHDVADHFNMTKDEVAAMLWS